MFLIIASRSYHRNLESICSRVVCNIVFIKHVHVNALNPGYIPACYENEIMGIGRKEAHMDIYTITGRRGEST
jgi:hypothetical protein